MKESWIERHINWTWGIVVCIIGLVSIPIAVVTDSTAIQVVLAIGIIGISIWLLHMKHRKISYIFVLLVPFGWIFLLWLENHNYVIDEINGVQIRRRRTPQD